jgi:hypothetical protein
MSKMHFKPITYLALPEVVRSIWATDRSNNWYVKDFGFACYYVRDKIYITSLKNNFWYWAKQAT